LGDYSESVAISPSSGLLIDDGLSGTWHLGDSTVGVNVLLHPGRTRSTPCYAWQRDRLYLRPDLSNNDPAGNGERVSIEC
jgi:hypothetical protein